MPLGATEKIKLGNMYKTYMKIVCAKSKSQVLCSVPVISATLHTEAEGLFEFGNLTAAQETPCFKWNVNESIWLNWMRTVKVLNFCIWSRHTIFSLWLWITV